MVTRSHRTKLDARDTALQKMHTVVGEVTFQLSARIAEGGMQVNERIAVSFSVLGYLCVHLFYLFGFGRVSGKFSERIVHR